MTADPTTAVPGSLYKYRRWNNPLHRTILTERKIYFSAPSEFPDPLDCKNPKRYDLLTEKERETWIEDLAKKMNPNWSRSARRTFAKQKARDRNIFNSGYLAQFEKEHWERWNLLYGVLSLTTNPLSDRMWVEYGNDHQGFCVGFHGTEIFKQQMNLGPVQYVSPLPTVYPEPRMSFREQITIQVFFKEKQWEFEEEYKCTIMSLDLTPLTPDKRVLVLPAAAYKEIILGRKMSAIDKRELVNSIPIELRHLEIKDLSK